MTREEQIEQVAHLIKGKSRNKEFIAFVQGALWADAHLWKSADGDDLPELEGLIKQVLGRLLQVWQTRSGSRYLMNNQ